MSSALGYSRTNPFTTQSDFGHNSSTSLGIQGLNISQYTTGLPNFTIGSGCGNEFTCLQGGTAFLPAHPVQTDIQVEDTFSWSKQNHSLKIRLPLRPCSGFAVYQHHHSRRADLQRQLHQ